MVLIENRVRSDKKGWQIFNLSCTIGTELKLTLEREYCEIDPMVNRKLEICNDVERNPGPNMGGKTPINDNPRVMKIEENIQEMQKSMANLDTSMATMLETLESMKPAYAHALRMLEKSSGASSGLEQKNNLVFYGIEPEPLEKQMEAEPEFCRDILETRIKTVFREVLKISRDIPFTHVYRFTVGNADKDEIRPIVAGFKSVRDKENILRHCTSSKILKTRGIYVTEDFSSKSSRQVDQEKTWRNGPLAAVEPGSPTKHMVAPLSPRKTKKEFNYDPPGSPTKNLGSPTKRQGTPASPKKSPASPLKAMNKNLKNNSNSLNGQTIDEAVPKSKKRNQLRRESRRDLESSAGMSDRMSSCSHSDYAPSSNSGNSSSGAYTDAEL